MWAAAGLGVVACAVLSIGAAAQSSEPAATPARKTVATDTETAKSHAKGSTSSSAKSRAGSHTAPAKRSPSTNSGHTTKSKYASSRKSGKKTARGQQKIEPERAQAIQEALIREHYMSGEPTGTWNQNSEEAMRRYQADHGWQSKQVPDSRALISLGLGPSHDHLLNPESAMTTGPDVSHAASMNSGPQMPVSHSAEPGARMSATPATPDAAPASPADHDASGPQ